MSRTLALVAIGLVMPLALGSPVLAQTFSSGSTGADGALSPPTGTTTLTVPPGGVFNFTTINIPAGATLRFTRNASNTPVTMLATGNVTIAGVIDISGGAGASSRIAASNVGSNGGTGGPGGYDGGSGAVAVVSGTGGGGLGPGGGTGGAGSPSGPGGGGGAGYVLAGGAGLGTAPGSGGATYGTVSVLPLVGGSGGGGGSAVPANSGAGGGGGGGALLIASSGTITVTGQILAQGGTGGAITGGGVAGGGGGSGGSVRLIAATVTGSNGVINIGGGSGGPATSVAGGAGSPGRVRVEAFTNTLAVSLGTGAVGVLSTSAPTSVTLPNAPNLRIASIGGVAAPATPVGSFTVADVVLPPGTTNPVSVAIEAANIPVGTAVTVSVKGLYGAVTSTSSALAGTLAASTASASVTIPTDEPSIVSAAASFVLTAAHGVEPVFVDGEEVERVRVTATPGGSSSVAYVTRSGREVTVRGAR